MYTYRYIHCIYRDTTAIATNDKSNLHFYATNVALQLIIDDDKLVAILYVFVYVMVAVFDVILCE